MIEKSDKALYLEENMNQRIMTCGELKTLKFNILDNDLTSLQNELKSKKFATYKDRNNFKNMFNSLSIYKDTKNGNKELKNLGPKFNTKSDVKIRPGSRILKIESERDYRELIERYTNEDFKKYDDSNVVGNRAIGCIDVNLLSKNYEGIYLSKEISEIMDEELNYYSDGNYSDINRSSRIIILNPDILVNANNKKIKPYRKGVSGKIFTLSEYSKAFSKNTFKNRFAFKAMNNYFKHRNIKPSNYIIDERFNEHSFETDYYLNDKNLNKEIKLLKDRLIKTNNQLNLYNGVLDFDSNYYNAHANAISKNVTFGIRFNLTMYNKYLSLKLISDVLSDKEKQNIFEEIGEAVLLHELGHVNNNPPRSSSMSDTLNYDELTGIYTVDKKAALSFMKEKLHRERLAWDYAFKIKPDSKILKWCAYQAYSSYVSSHIADKKNGFTYLTTIYGERIKVYFR